MCTITRRRLIGSSAAATAAAVAAPHVALAQAPAAPPTLVPGPFKQQPLPFAETALAPAIGPRTVTLHYGRHGTAYFNALNTLTKDTKYASMTLEQVVVEANKESDRRLYNNASQAWNHNFYWDTFKPGGAKTAGGRLGDMIKESFGSFEAMKQKLQADTTAVFGCGWGWLAQDGNKIVVATTSQGDGLLTRNLNPLIGLDVWEHSYYLDYENRRGDHLNAVLDNIVNWDVVAGRLKA